jgi:hypothetical protein
MVEITLYHPLHIFKTKGAPLFLVGKMLPPRNLLKDQDPELIASI